MKLLGEIVLYATHDDHLATFAQILASPDLLNTYLRNPDLNLIGLAHAFHNAVSDCVVLVFSDQAKEDTKELMKLRQAEEKAQ